MHFLVAEGDSQDFREINQQELGTEDLEMGRVSAVTGNSPSAVDVLWKNLTIRAEGLPGLPGGSPDVKPFSWWIPVLGTLVLAIAGAVFWWRAVAQRRAAKVAKQRKGLQEPRSSGKREGEVPGKKAVPRGTREGKLLE